jgi:hypothetical protein
VTFGLDYDGTYNEASDLWDAFVANARAQGHKVVCVTCRRETLENVQECDVPGVLTYFTGGAPKQWFMEQRGVSIDVWIDNEPRVILYGR